MVSNPLPMIDLTERQSMNMNTIPLHFYSGDVARVPAGIGSSHGSSHGGSHGGSGTMRLRVRGNGGDGERQQERTGGRKIEGGMVVSDFDGENDAMDRPLL
jgi:hypothetical protein